jgi:prepilin peptidase CpaA
LLYFDTARELILLALLVAAAFTDLAYGKVHNWCTFPAIMLGLMLAYISGGIDERGRFNLVQSVLGILLTGGIFGVLFLLGGFGAGDVKLAVAVGALKGWFFSLWAIACTSVVGLILALGVLVWKGQFWRGLWQSLAAVVRVRRAERVSEGSPAALTVPYGFAISAGTLWAWLLLEARVF